MGVPVFSNWLRFSGRRNRKSYLVIFLIFFVAMLAIEIILGRLFLSGAIPSYMFWIYFVIMIPIKFVYFVITAQRLRDFNLSGWFVLILIPIAFFDQDAYGLPSLAVTFFIMIIPGTRGDNRYGPDPIGDLHPDSDPGPISRYEASRRSGDRPSLSNLKKPPDPQ